MLVALVSYTDSATQIACSIFPVQILQAICAGHAVCLGTRLLWVGIILWDVGTFNIALIFTDLLDSPLPAVEGIVRSTHCVQYL